MTKSEAIEVLQRNAVFCDAELEDAINLAISALKKQEQDRWIPCSERLPEDDKNVLCIAKSKFGRFYCVASHGKMYPGSDEVGWITTDYNRIVESVISAWRPLPESYKAEE